ncbi:L-histidine N(alpha)-methyltransferase [Pseudonocardia sp. RS11V-5]|uniref:L-histidine N(alpha)-methyltransferase n=1 Tax=Pseudonocardia terrae TaxID=2905831 RepID=UPI001E2B6B1F|nr:L-histidine N(alpha)-methyltransferase [Pseudonocardia terrae]MCE3549908.1 L-histidine N(alpha)-methyltransferase [Pseudonocardia terrae]
MPPPDTAVLAVDDAFWDDGAQLTECLREPVPRIPPHFGYDALGSQLFEAITELPTYYLTRVERAMLERHAGEIAAALDTPRLAELGSGSGKKTRLLLDACLRRRPTTYLPVDVSREMLEHSAATLTVALPALVVRGLWGRYEAGLAQLRTDGEPVVVAFLGSNVGNTTPAERAALFAEVAAALRPGDGFLVSADLVKPPAALERCYNDPPGYDAFRRFRLNHLSHLNRRFGADFGLENYEPRAHAVGPVVEGHLYALTDHTAVLPALGAELELRRGDSINVGFSAKFTPEGLATELAPHGFALQTAWVDDAEPYGIFLHRLAA